MRRPIALLAVTVACLAFAPSAAARRSSMSIGFRVVDIGSVIAFDVDLCSRDLARVRFEGDFRQGQRGFGYRSWRRETYGEGCARLFLGIPDRRDLFAPGAVDARLRISVAGAQRAHATRWRRFYVN